MPNAMSQRDSTALNMSSVHLLMVPTSSAMEAHANHTVKMEVVLSAWMGRKKYLWSDVILQHDKPALKAGTYAIAERKPNAKGVC